MLYPVSREQVAEIYVATFNRAPDQAGLVYWSTHADFKTIEPIAESFFYQEETQLLYPNTMDNSEFVNEIYNNLFNQDAEPAGLAYWVNELNSGITSRANMIISIVNGAQGMDQKTLDNKTEVGLYFAQNGKTLTIAQAYEVMVDVTNQDPSVVKALSMIDNWSGGSGGIELTTAIDIIDPYDSSDIINGIVDTDAPENSTLNTGDIIDGGGGNDTLTVKILSGSSLTTNVYIPHMSNVEELAIESAADNVTLDLSGTTELDTITLNATEGKLTLTSSNEGTAKLIDGSDSTGELTILGGVVAVDGSTILGGTANDTIDLSSAPSSSINEITGGKGGDDITASNGKDILYYADFGDTGTIESEVASDGVITYTYSSMETADTISNFASGSDQISFEVLAPGNTDNFAKGAKETSGFHDALKASYDDVGELHFTIDPITGDITDAFVTSTGVVYSYQYDGGKAGYLFIDSDNDGLVDQWIILAGLDAADFNFGDIV